MFQNRKRILNKMRDLACFPMRFLYSYFNRDIGYKLRNVRTGFTIVEILIVVVILSIAALTAIPLMSSASSFQIRSAANMIAADLEYAKSMAISRGQYYSVVFNEGMDSYRIEDQDSTVIEHPVNKGFSYVIDFPNDSRLSKVNITNVTFIDDKVRFDCLGSPDNGGTINLSADSHSAIITVEPVTGFVSVSIL